MSRLSAFCLFAITLGLAGHAFGQTVMPERIKAPRQMPVTGTTKLVIDLGGKIPQEIVLLQGEAIAFTNNSNHPSFKVKETDGKGALLSQRMHSTNQVAAFQADRAGTGEIEVFFPVQGFLQVTKTVTIKVTVKDATIPKAAKTIDLNAALPAKVELSKGDTVVFKNGPATITAKSDDGNGTLMAARPHNTFDQVAAFQATRTGTGEFTVTITVNGTSTTKTIKIEVK